MISYKTRIRNICLLAIATLQVRDNKDLNLDIEIRDAGIILKGISWIIRSKIGD